MTKSKRYKRTRFPASVIGKVIEMFGPDRELIHAEVTIDDVTVSYDSESDFLVGYVPPVSSALIDVAGKRRSIHFHDMGDVCNVSVQSEDSGFIDDVIGVLDQSAPEAQVALAARPLDIRRFCVVAPVHWESLPLLPVRLEKKGIQINEQSIEITRYPTTIEYSEWDRVLADIREHGEPKWFRVALHGRTDLGGLTLRLNKDKYVRSGETFMCLSVSGTADEDTVDEISAFLGLEPDDAASPATLDRTAFIAHRFDAQGEQFADRLARFLGLLGFDVKTGRDFSPQGVGDKVKKRLRTQAVVFVILTPGDDATWLTQESVLGHAENKPLFVLRDRQTDFNPGIFGDLEYIPFTAPHIEGSFVAILEGLKELGFLRFAHS
ncbi:MAG: hypothetical protein WBE26_10350 [Phycisphaerae bacterium]